MGVRQSKGLGDIDRLFWVGQAKTRNYRIEVRKEHLQMNFPREPVVSVRWDQIEEMYGEGQAIDTRIGDGKGQALHWSPQWENLRISLTDGTRRDLDLRPLSVEKRGRLMRAIAGKAQLQGDVVIVPAK